MSKDELHAFRRQQIEDYRNSSQSAETWCEANAMKVSTLRYWLRRIKDADQPVPEQAWVFIVRYKYPKGKSVIPHLGNGEFLKNAKVIAGTTN